MNSIVDNKYELNNTPLMLLTKENTEGSLTEEQKQIIVSCILGDNIKKFIDLPKPYLLSEFHYKLPL